MPMNTIFRIIAGPGVLALAAGASLAGAAPATSALPARVVVVQALPGADLTVAIDGRKLDHGADVGAVLGPYALAPGSHRVRFTDSSGTVNVDSTLTVAAGSSTDVVIHRPAEVGGAPVLNTYHTTTAPLGPDKARVLIAHTATVAPADVRVDGVVVFRDIANGEYATADLAAGHHTVALLPAGLTTHPILGPLKVDLTAGTVTMVYAVGSPKDHSMNVVVHTATLASMTTGTPATIDTGAAGLVAGREVHTFSASHRQTPVASTSSSTSREPWLMMTGAAALAVLLLGLTVTAQRARSGVRR
jgi:Domain of unknown function (DUF4397)